MVEIAAKELPGNIRWRVFALLFAVAFVSYTLRQNIHVAAEIMMPELGISEMQMGLVFSSFVWSYALFQLPGGILGQVVGFRRGFMIIGIVWVLTTVLVAAVPGAIVSSTTGIVAALVVLRFVVGMSHAPLFPMQAGVIAAWFPYAGWGFPQALLVSGLTLGAAATQPVVAWTMTHWGWRASFYILVPVTLAVFGLIWWYLRDSPALHRSVKPAELAFIRRGKEGSTAFGNADPGAWKHLLRNRDTLLLSLSYFSMNWVFYIFFAWFFHYLVAVRGFSILESGFMAAMPWLAGSIAAPLGGWSCDVLSRRLGPRWGCRIPGIAGMMSVAILLWGGVAAPNPYIAVALLSLCFAGTQFTEASFWAAQTFIAGDNTAAGTGILNTGGNLAGIVVTPLMPFLAHQFGWEAALSTGSLFAVISSALWLMVRADRPFTTPADTR